MCGWYLDSKYGDGYGKAKSAVLDDCHKRGGQFAARDSFLVKNL
jgi:hypothetical protein